MDQLGKLIRKPLLVVDGRGYIVDANARAREAFGDRIEVWSDVFADPEQLRGLLQITSGSGEPVLRALQFRHNGETLRHRVSAVRLHDSGQLTVAIQVQDQEEDQFAALTERVRQLNAEIDQRQRTQARLEQSLAHNRSLYRELQHRVKNQLQMMMAMVSAARRETTDPAQRSFANALQSKLSALFEAQRLMYLEAEHDCVPLGDMVRSIARTMLALTGSRVALDMTTEPVAVSNDVAFPIALIANELLTIAIEDADGTPDARVALGLRRQGADAALEVSGTGASFAIEATNRSSSGLGLVRGLCRQVGGQLALRPGGEGTTIACVSVPVAQP